MNVGLFHRMAYIGQNFKAADLKTYLTKYRSEASGYTIPVTTIDGAINIGLFPVRLLGVFNYSAVLDLIFL